MMRLSLCIAIAFLAACTVALDFGLEGHVCGPLPDSACRSGYTCSAANICVPLSQAECQPACGPFEECVRQKCVATCKDKACPSGTECREGACEIVPAAVPSGGLANLGALCQTDSDCEDPKAPRRSGLFCLIPFGGHASGFCSLDCSHGEKCGGSAPTCKPFRSDTRSESVSLCVANAFTACETDTVCAPSGLVCGVYETGTTIGTADIRAASACRAPVPASAGAVAIGAACQPDVNPCINGLCIPTSTTGQSICAKQCADSSDCADCTSVTVGGRILGTNYPYVRASMCVAGGTIGVECGDNDPAHVCQANAPNCINGVCAPHCTDGFENRCLGFPTFTCDGTYCLKQQ